MQYGHSCGFHVRKRAAGTLTSGPNDSIYPKRMLSSTISVQDAIWAGHCREEGRGLQKAMEGVGERNPSLNVGVAAENDSVARGLSLLITRWSLQRLFLAAPLDKAKYSPTWKGHDLSRTT